MVWVSYPDVVPSRISEQAFKIIPWVFYAFAISMAMARTSFRVYTFRRLDLDDSFLILASLCLTAAVIIIHILYPYMLKQNQASLGQFIPGPDFPAEMLEAKKLECTSAHLIWFCIYSVKYSYLFFFRKLIQRQPKFMIWWWVVFGVTAACTATGIVFDWYICPNFSINFLESCPVWLITLREHVWLIVTTTLDIVSDTFIISVPIMILWNVKIPLKAKFGIGAALCLSLCMMVIAVLRITLGTVVPGVTDTVWTYFTFSIEASTAVFMVSATAFRSTFGHRKSTKADNSDKSNQTPMGNISRRGPNQAHGRPAISSPQRVDWYEKEDLYAKTIYQPEVEERVERTRDMV